MAKEGLLFCKKEAKNFSRVLRTKPDERDWLQAPQAVRRSNTCGDHRSAYEAPGKSLLVLFFRKDLLASGLYSAAARVAGSKAGRSASERTWAYLALMSNRLAAWAKAERSKQQSSMTMVL